MKTKIIPGSHSLTDILSILDEEGLDIPSDPPPPSEEGVSPVAIVHSNRQYVKYGSSNASYRDVQEVIENPTVEEIRNAAHGNLEKSSSDDFTRVEAEVTMNTIDPFN